MSIRRHTTAKHSGAGAGGRASSGRAALSSPVSQPRQPRKKARQFVSQPMQPSIASTNPRTSRGCPPPTSAPSAPAAVIKQRSRSLTCPRAKLVPLAVTLLCASFPSPSLTHTQPAYTVFFSPTTYLSSTPPSLLPSPLSTPPAVPLPLPHSDNHHGYRCLQQEPPQRQGAGQDCRMSALVADSGHASR